MGDRLHGFLIQPQTEALANPDVANIAFRIHFDSEHDHALVLGFASLFRKFGFHFVDQLGRRDAGSPMHAESGRPECGFADALAAAVVAEAVVAVDPERALGQAAIGIAGVRAGVDQGNVESDCDRECDQGMIGWTLVE
jgi:hypothetical protein